MLQMRKFVKEALSLAVLATLVPESLQSVKPQGGREKSATAKNRIIRIVKVIEYS
jgi:hypothetical protein